MEESNFIIKITRAANNDLEEIYRYISEFFFAEDAAVKLLDLMESSIMQLKQFPYSGSYISDETL